MVHLDMLTHEFKSAGPLVLHGWLLGFLAACFPREGASSSCFCCVWLALFLFLHLDAFAFARRLSVVQDLGCHD